MSKNDIEEIKIQKTPFEKILSLRSAFYKIYKDKNIKLRVLVPAKKTMKKSLISFSKHITGPKSYGKICKYLIHPNSSGEESPTLPNERKKRLEVGIEHFPTVYDVLDSVLESQSVTFYDKYPKKALKMPYLLIHNIDYYEISTLQKLFSNIGKTINSFTFYERFIFLINFKGIYERKDYEIKYTFYMGELSIMGKFRSLNVCKMVNKSLEVEKFVRNCFGHHAKVFWFKYKKKQNTQFSVILRNLTPEFGSENINNLLTENFEGIKINYISEPFLISNIYCSIVYVSNLEDAERICVKLHKKIRLNDKFVIQVSFIINNSKKICDKN